MEGKKSKVILFDEEIRKEAKRLGIDKMSREELQREINFDSLRNDPIGRKFLARLTKGDGIGANKIIKEEIKKLKQLKRKLIAYYYNLSKSEYEELEESRRELFERLIKEDIEDSEE